MGKFENILFLVLSGVSDQNIRFSDLCWLLKRLRFDERIRGSHHIFTRDNIAEIINIQPKRKHAKPYQVKQVRTLILKYKLGGSDAE